MERKQCLPEVEKEREKKKKILIKEMLYLSWGHIFSLKQKVLGHEQPCWVNGRSLLSFDF